VRLAKAWSLILEWKFDEARTILTSVRESLAARATDDMLYLHCTMMLAQFQDDMPTVEKQCVTLLERGMDADPYLVGTYYTSLLYAEREQFKLLNFERYDARARDYFLRAGSRFVLVWHQAIAGPTRFLAGDTALAIETLRDGLDAAAAIGGRDSGLASIPALLLAEVHYERNELEVAAELLDRHLARASELGFVDQLVAGFVTQSRLHRLRGDVRDAERALGSGMDLAYTRGFRRLRLNIVAEQMAHSLASGDVDRVVRLAAVHDVRVPIEAVLPRPGATTGSEAHALAWTSLARAEGRTAEALRVAKRWQRFAEQAGARRSDVRWGALVAHLLLQGGDARSPRPRRAGSSGRCSTSVARCRSCSPRLPAARTRRTRQRPSDAISCGSRRARREGWVPASSPSPKPRSPRASR
jgi:LuxR family maltose regulon positive regulatory protein